MCACHLCERTENMRSCWYTFKRLILWGNARLQPQLSPAKQQLCIECMQNSFLRNKIYTDKITNLMKYNLLLMYKIYNNIYKYLTFWPSSIRKSLQNTAIYFCVRFCLLTYFYWFWSNVLAEIMHSFKTPICNNSTL